MSVVCEAQWCATRPAFGYRGEAARFCAEHRVPDMVNMARVRKGLCEADGCSRISSFAEPGQHSRFCAEHRAPGMIDVRRPRVATCEVDGCMVRPAFAEPGQRARFCSEHCAPGMVRVGRELRAHAEHHAHRHVEVHNNEPATVDRGCMIPNCRNRPVYGLVATHPVMCASHRDAIVAMNNFAN